MTGDDRDDKPRNPSATPTDAISQIERLAIESISTVSGPHRVAETLDAVKPLAGLSLASVVSAETSTGDRQTWGRLELRRELGRGSFGVVYLAWDLALQREIALKVLLNEESTVAVIEEARLLARIRNENVVTVHGVDEYKGTFGLRMEFVDGLTLKQLLASRGVLSANEAALIGIDLCRAVAAVHKAGLLHRDIKTHNVMREAGGRIVLMDFGAGTIRESDAHYRRAGTPLYLAPEIIDGRPASIASDIYSLGVLLFHLVTLRYPVPATTYDELVEAHAQKRRIPLVDLRPNLPMGFVRVVETALDKDPACRYRTVGAMQQELGSTIDFASFAEQTAINLRSTMTSSIAVMPFLNLGPDQDAEYLCDGLAEELRIGLGAIRGLRVASRSATRLCQTIDARALCRQLNVTAVLEGTVRKSGDRVRITVQLVRGDDGCHIWSEGYNREIADVVDVEEDIAQRVVENLQITLAELQSSQLIRRHTDNQRAYHLYLKGRFYASPRRRYQSGISTALDYFLKALEEDAGYAAAYAGIAELYAVVAFYCMHRPRDAFAKASVAVERALALDPNLAEAHVSLALIKLGDNWVFPAAEAELRRAIELDRTLTVPRLYLAWVRVLRGDPPGGLVEARRAQEIEPLSPLVNAAVGYTLYLSRRYDDAIDELEKSLEVDPDYVVAIHFMAMCRAQQLRLNEAIELSERTVEMSNRAPFYVGLLGHFCARAGQRERVEAILAELNALSGVKYVPPHAIAYIYAGLDDLDRAFEWESKAYEDGASPFNYFSPIIDNLQRDPRRAVELRRMGLQL